MCERMYESVYVCERETVCVCVPTLPVQRLPLRLTFLGGEDVHVPGDGVAPPGDGHVQPVVAAHLGVGPAPPLLVGLQRGHALPVNHKVNWNTTTRSSQRYVYNICTGTELYTHQYRRKGFILMMHLTHFIYGYMASDIR